MWYNGLDANDSHLGLNWFELCVWAGRISHKHISSTVSILIIYTVVDNDSLLVSRQ